MDLTVIIPAYNEGDRVFENLLETTEVLRSLPMSLSWEIILVDDGSGDETHAEARKAQAQIPELRIVTYPRNRGKGFALRQGSNEALGDHIVFLDADLEIHPNQIPILLKILSRNPTDLVIGSKNHRQSSYAFPLFRRVLSALYSWLVKIMFRLPVADTQTGLKLFRRQALLDALPAVQSSTFAFDLDLLVQIHRKGYRISEAPVNIRFLRAASRVTTRDVWLIWADLVKLFYRLHAPAFLVRRGPQPLREPAQSPKTSTEVGIDQAGVEP